MKKRFTIITLLALLASCGGARGGKTSTKSSSKTEEPATTKVAVTAEQTPAKVYTYKVINSYPHSTESYTQGLVYHNGKLLEGTGLNGKSRLQSVDITSGKITNIATLPTEHFGEGVTLLNDVIYQLTWETNRLFTYDAKSGKPLGEYIYAGEGWGLTTDGKELYMSDGSSIIMVRSPKDFSIVRRFDVKLDGQSIKYINELEWINGKIWANVYTSPYILIIDPASGYVEGYIDMNGLLSDKDITPTTNVLNGIAYDAEGDRIFVTGKNWSRLFEIKIDETSNR